MTLDPGKRLGPYQIVAPLGAGGMGEVYRARDTRLGRDVAVKVLPAKLSQSAEFRARFEREAKAISSLNHPHICVLHDVGREGDVDYLVMELVEGETLAARIAKGALAPGEVFRIGGQIADALDRAHRAGIVHRDLKPGNVMLTKSGAKLMDFGLARAMGVIAGEGGATATLADSAAAGRPLTAEGTIIGTIQYMAPEQLEGQDVDARADLWALGCVLYEMATGKRAFQGETQASTLAAVLREEPERITDLVPGIPPDLEQMILHCLRKDPARRLQSTTDIKITLKRVTDNYKVSHTGTLVPLRPLSGLWSRYLLVMLIATVIAGNWRPFGSLFFASRDVDRFTEDDIDFARRVADHLALALSHQHLAEAASTAARLEAKVATLTRELEARGGVRRVVGHSKQWKDVLAHATRVAQTETTVLLTGESGTGKEVVARFLHHASRRNHGPFTAINCAALPEALLESELFGHERGAFTGAVATKPGRIEQAAGGVLFLDEVGEMAPTVQAKLLRVLEEREFMRLGSTRVMRADIRVIAATNRDLQAAIQRGGFREDLYYRLGVFEIHLPPLRERLDDIIELAEMFLAEIGETVGRPAAGISRDAKEQLMAYGWPGNVRELRNAIERAVVLADDGVVTTQHLPDTVRGERRALATGGGMRAEVADTERRAIEEALQAEDGNQTRAARRLGISRRALLYKLDKHGLKG
jgi:transcriptional regulator with GAF, ATPase, and Fis domain/aminoglycoside phosphotransferase (APT) family kinase protein